MIIKSLKKYISLLSCIGLLLLVSCKKNSSTPAFMKSENYYPVASGKIWIYRLDSTTIPAFGTSLVTRSYHLKDSMGISFIDNTGRESWPVYRFITDTLEQNPWQSLSTYYVTPAGNSIEVVDDNNLRFIKLVTPVRENYSWQGNAYIDTRYASVRVLTNRKIT